MGCILLDCSLVSTCETEAITGSSGGTENSMGGAARLDPVGIVQQDAQVADPPHARVHARRRVTRFDPRVTQDAFLGLARAPVVVSLLVGAGRDAHAPSAATGLIDGHHAVLTA